MTRWCANLAALNMDDAFFHRLSERFQGVAAEFRKLVEKEQAVMGE